MNSRSRGVYSTVVPILNHKQVASTLNTPWRNVFEECCNGSSIGDNFGGAGGGTICPDGFAHNPTLNVCDDIDECVNGGHDCNVDKEVCRNVVGGFLCEPLDYDDEPTPTQEQKCPLGCLNFAY